MNSCCSVSKIRVYAGLLFSKLETRIESGNENGRVGTVRVTPKSRYSVGKHDRAAQDAVEVRVCSGYTLPRRGGRVVECGGLENRYVGNPGVGGSNPPLSAEARRRLERAARFALKGSLLASRLGVGRQAR
jgi:hypothetical protein